MPVWTRQKAREITKLHLTNKKMTEGLKQVILEVVPDYPQIYFESWFKRTHNYSKGIGGTEAGPGTDYVLGFLDACKELNFDISLAIEATKKWRKNNKRELAIKEWLTQNT